MLEISQIHSSSQPRKPFLCLLDSGATGCWISREKLPPHIRTYHVAPVTNQTLAGNFTANFSEALVKDHEGDAQLIIELLHEHHTGNSQYSRSEINRITKYLTNIKLDDTWRGTNESFLMHYNDQLRLLDSLVDSDEKLPDNTRVTFLESAVESVPDLRRVKITDNVLQAQLDSTRPITYRSYFDLLKDAAFHLDQATKRGSKIRRTNVHFSGPNNEDDHQNLLSDDHQVIQQEDVCSEPPEPLSYSVFQSHFQGSSTSSTQKIFLPKPIWEKLSKDQQQMIIDHNRSLPKSGSSSISTPNKSPSPLPHKPTPQQTAKSQQVHTHQSDESTADTTKVETTPSDPLLAMVHQSIHTSDDDASDITKVLSAKRSRQIQVCKHYIFQHANHTNNQLVDRGANGGLAGSDMRVINKTHRKINISGIDNHEVNGLDVVTAATLLNTSLGKVIGIFNEYAHLGKGSSIHSSGQLEWFKTHVDEKSIKVGGTQLITTLDGYSVPLLIKDGLAYATSLGRPTDQDMDTYPHVFFTSPDEWDPSVLDHDPPPLDGLDPSQVLDQPFGDPMFDAGDFNERIIANLNILLDAPPEDYRSYIANLHQGSSQEPDWNALRPFFAWTSPSSIQDTFNVTTRHGTAPHTQDYIKKHFKSRNPVFNIPRRSEAVATDTIFSDTPAVDDGSTMAQFFCGRDTLVCDAYGIKSTKQFINTLSDNIRKRGAMDTLISDGGKYEISKQVTDLLRSLFIQDYQSEPYHQHQNKAENRFGLAKRYTNTVMNTSGCPACCWLLCLQYICVVLNHLASPTLQGICPVQALEGTTPDISFLLHFSFYEPVYYRIDSSEPDLNFLHHLMKRKVIGLALLTTKVTLSPGGSSLRILKRSSFVLVSEVPSELQQTSVLHHLQGRGPHFLFPFLIHNNLKILCHLTLLMHQPPILSTLSKVRLVKMKIIQSPWPTLTSPISLADPSFYHLKIMGSATWPKSLTLMTMDRLLKTLNSS